MKRPIVLNVTSCFEQELSRTTQQATWRAFMNGGSNHSAQAITLPYIMRRCEREGIGYVLTAVPGVGYFIKPQKEGDVT